MTQLSSQFLKQQWFWIVLAVGYLVTHLVSLGALPVFSDEAIYIRWSQLLSEDPGRYAFFAMNDGKTPLYVWLLSPFLAVFSDPLVGSRFASVVIGAVQIGALVLFLKALGASDRAQKIGALLVVIVPFWYFHHRMALMDGLLVLWLTLFSWGVVRLSQLGGVGARTKAEEKTTRQQRARPNNLLGLYKLFESAIVQAFREILTNSESRRLILLTGLFFGLALWTKVPAVLFVPAGAALILARPAPDLFSIVLCLVRVGVSVIVGVAVFLLLALHPSFAQLFNRGSDFLLSGSEVASGAWIAGLYNIPAYLEYFIYYLTPGASILAVLGLFLPAGKRRQLVLVVAAVIFMLPIALLGKVVYARYLLPMMIFLTAAAALTLDTLLTRLQQLEGVSRKKLVLSVGVALLCTQIASISAAFMFYSLISPSETPYVTSDRTQYLTEWSSGHGIVEVYTLLQQASTTRSADSPQDSQTLAVATEGFFGTLPDGLVLYNHAKPLAGVYIEGIGQPIGGLPEWFVDRAAQYEKTWLVVNSHRLLIEYPPENLVAEYCRPFDAPCLQVWDVTEVVKRAREVIPD